MKRTVCLCLLLLIFLCGCSVEKPPAALEKSVTLDKSGVVSAETFKNLKEQNKICTFKGNDGRIKYEWTVIGKNIKSPAEQIFKITVKSVTDNEATFEFASKKDFDFCPSVSLYLDRKWQADEAVSSNGDTVSLSQKENTVITLAAVHTGTVTVTGKMTEKVASSASSKNGVSDDTQKKQDKYKTDPVPEGKPLPVDTPQKSTPKADKKDLYCTISIECSTILSNLNALDSDKLEELPAGGVILGSVRVKLSEGDTVFDILKTVCEQNEIQTEYEFTPLYNSYYIKGIGNIYEFDCGEGSGWMYRVNGWYPNYGCSRYEVKDGDKIEFRYTCNLGEDIGNGFGG